METAEEWLKKVIEGLQIIYFCGRTKEEEEKGIMAFLEVAEMAGKRKIA